MSDETQKLEERAARARAEMAERAKRREERDAAQRAQREVEALELENRIDAAIEDAEADGLEIGKTFVRVDVSYPDGTLIGAVLLKAPHPLKWGAFENQIGSAKGRKNDELRDQLWHGCLVWPDVATAEGYVEAQGFNRQRFADAIAELAGIKREEIAKK